MNSETARVDPATFLRMSGYEGKVPRPASFPADETEAIIDRALEATRRVADEVEQDRKRAVEAARVGAQSSPAQRPGTVEAQKVAPRRELADYPSPPQFPAPPPIMAPKWEPTHLVPPSGLPAWREPNPAVPPTTSLRAKLPVRVLRVVNGWAQVKSAIGRTWWVDAAPLVPINPPQR